MDKENEIEYFEEDEDYISQGFGPDDFARTMGLYDDEDGWSNDDGCFLGHDCFD